MNRAIALSRRDFLTAAGAATAQPTADFDKKWGNFVITPPTFTTLVYQGV